MRLEERKHELLKVLERSEIPLSTNAAENDLRNFVTQRRISRLRKSRDGNRDTRLGPMKSWKNSLSFYHDLGDRLGVAGKTVPSLALVLARLS